MAKPPKFADVSSEYWKLFLECRVNSDKLAEVQRIANSISLNRVRYQTVTTGLGSMPWWFVGLIHSLEGGLSFTTHLHNGDPLTGRTTHVPAGRPVANPAANPKQAPSATNPYTWEESATDALRQKNLNAWADWSIVGSLFQLEAYNGWGYRMYHPKVLSPYLWSFTNHYTKGKYASDGKWSATLVSAQAGAAAILRVLVDSGVVVATDYRGDFPTPKAGIAYA
jgi:lysozyme family protein